MKCVYSINMCLCQPLPISNAPATIALRLCLSVVLSRSFLFTSHNTLSMYSMSFSLVFCCCFLVLLLIFLYARLFSPLAPRSQHSLLYASLFAPLVFHLSVLSGLYWFPIRIQIRKLRIWILKRVFLDSEPFEAGFRLRFEVGFARFEAGFGTAPFQIRNR